MASNKQQLDVYGIIQEHLQEPDVVKIAAKCKSSTDATTDAVLAIISNVHNEHDAEQAALITVEVSQSHPEGLITGICPIFDDFTFSIEQYDSSQAILHSKLNLELAGKPIPASFIVKFSSNAGAIVLNVITQDISELSDLMQEIRRLTDIAGKHQYPANATPPSHAWLRAYSITSPTGQSRSFSLRSPKRSDTFSSLLSSYGSRALEGLPTTVTNTLGSFMSVAPAASASVPRKATLVAKVKETVDPRLTDEVQSELVARRKEFISSSDLRIHVATFNAGGNFYDSKASESMSSWLCPDEQPDILVVGLQEMDLRPEVLMVRHDPAVGHTWITAILACLNGQAGSDGRKAYQCLEMKQLAGMYIAVFADTELVQDGTIAEVTTSSVMTGWAGFAGNKGACGIRMRVNDQYLCFVSAHLAAFQEHADRRNADYRDICTRMIFSPSRRNEAGHSIADESGTLYYPGLFDADALFFFGDLNYRIDLPMEAIKTALASKEYDTLVRHDQLKHAQARHRISPEVAFVDFDEAEITFPPTYKYDVGTDDYDSSEKERKPAWTDRILWHIPPAAAEGDVGAEASSVKVKCTRYASPTDFRLSDHKPVLAAFSLQLAKVDAHRRSEIIDELSKQS